MQTNPGMGAGDRHLLFADVARSYKLFVFADSLWNPDSRRKKPLGRSDEREKQCRDLYYKMRSRLMRSVQEAMRQKDPIYPLSLIGEVMTRLQIDADSQDRVGLFLEPRLLPRSEDYEQEVRMAVNRHGQVRLHVLYNGEFGPHGRDHDHAIIVVNPDWSVAATPVIIDRHKPMSVR